VLEGLVITLLVLTGLRRALFSGIPLPLKKAMAIGIGFFVLFIGLVDGGLVVNDEATFVRLGELTGVPVAVTVFGLIVTIVLLARGWRFAILIGIVLSTALAIVLNYAAGATAFRPGVAVLPTRLVTAPDFSLVGAFDFSAFAQLGVAATVLWIFSIMLTDFFDTMGSLFGVGDAAGYLDRNGDLPEAHKPLLVDSVAAVFGGAVSASTATTYVESGAGVGVGGRTGWVAVVVGLLFLAAMPFSPVVAVVPVNATAPALIIVGYLMMRTITAGHSGLQSPGLGRETLPGVDFGDFAFGLPAVLIITVMPLTYSITNGIGAGFIAFTLIRVAQGRARELGWVMWAATAGFVVYFAAPLLRQLVG
jgi:AGZA family xanthine/uracil permease-like MFS transporter